MADINLGIDPIGLADSIFDFSGNQDRADRQMASDENWRRIYFQDQRDARWTQESFYRDAVKRDAKKIRTLVKDAQAAGISPLAALGSAGASPANISIPQGRTGGTIHSKPAFQRDIANMMNINTKLNLIKTAAEAKKSNAEAEAMQTTYAPKSVEYVPRTDKVDDTGQRPSATHYNVGRGVESQQMRMPSQEWPDLDQIITFLIADMMGTYKGNQVIRDQWDELRKKPDRTGRFQYLQSYDDAGDIAP